MSRPLPAPLEVLSHRDFRIYWLGQAISLVGTWMQIMAQGWVVTRLSDRALVLGALNLAAALPMALLAMKAGTLVDRGDKRRILLVTQVLMAVLALVMAALVSLGVTEVWHLMVLAVLTGAVSAFEFPASQALAPELVPPALIPRAVALLQAIFHGGRLIGPALAGQLMAAYGETSAFIANAVSFLAVIASLLVIQGRTPGAASASGRGGGPPGGEFMAYLRGDAVTTQLLTVLALLMALVFPFLAVLAVFFARHVIGTDSAGVGLMMSASGSGALVGSVALIISNPERWRGRLWQGLVGVALSLALLSRVSTLPWAMVLLSLASFSVSRLMGTISQTVQVRVPGPLRGRVMALFGIAFTTILPVSAMVMSALSDQVGMPVLMLGCAVAFLSLGGAMLLRMTAGAPIPAPEVPSPAADRAPAES